MKKINTLFLIAAFFSIFVVTANQPEVDAIFGLNGLNADGLSLKKIKELFAHLSIASSCQLYKISHLVIEEIEHHESEIKEVIKRHNENNQIVSQHYFFTLFYLAHQKEYLAAYAKKVYKELSIMEKFKCSIFAAV